MARAAPGRFETPPQYRGKGTPQSGFLKAYSMVLSDCLFHLGLQLLFRWVLTRQSMRQNSLRALQIQGPHGKHAVECTFEAVPLIAKPILEQS